MGVLAVVGVTECMKDERGGTQRENCPSRSTAQRAMDVEVQVESVEVKLRRLLQELSSLGTSVTAWKSHDQVSTSVLDCDRNPTSDMMVRDGMRRSSALGVLLVCDHIQPVHSN